MAILTTEPVQVATSLPATPPASGQVLSQSDVLSTASSIIQSYPSITSAFLFGSYAKDTARPDSDIDIALFVPDLRWDNLADIGGVQMDLEGALDRQVDLSVCPPDDFVENIKRYWVPIDLHCGKPGTQKSEESSSSSTQSLNQNQVSSGSSGISPISQSSSTTTNISPRHGDDPSIDSDPCAINRNGGLTLASTPRQSSSPSPSPPSPQTPMVITGKVELKITGQTANKEEAVRCREEGESSLSKKELEQVHMAKP